MAKTPKLTRLRVYPVKALEGMDVDAWQLDTYGLRLDRRWMVVDADGRCLTRREHPALAAVSAEIDRDRLILNAPHEPAVELPLEPEPGPTEPVIIAGETVAVREVSDDADRWLSLWLRTACRIVYLPDSRSRSVDPALGTRKAQLAFQDELPIQLLTIASLHDLNRRLRGGVPIEALRPNLVIEGGGPAYAEDGWSRLRIGEVEVHLVKPWPHDAIVRPGGDVSGQDPVEELVSYRTHDGRPCIGQLGIATTTVGLLRVGNTVEILERGKAPAFGPPELEPLAEDRPDNVEPEEEAAEAAPRSSRRRKHAEDRKKVRVIQLPVERGSRAARGTDSEAGPDPWEAAPAAEAPAEAERVDDVAAEAAEEAALEEAAAAEPQAGEDVEEPAAVVEPPPAAPAAPEPPVEEEPAATEPVAEKPTAAEKAAAAEPSTAEPSTAEPSTAEPTTEESAVEAPAAEQPATRTSATPAPTAPGPGPAATSLPEGLEVTTGRMPDLQQTVRLLAAAAVSDSTGEAQRLAEACLRAPVLVTAWKDDTLVGLLRGWTDEVRDGFIADVAVHPDHHASGAAQELVRQAVAGRPAIRWVLRASPGSAYLGSALGWQHAGSGWYLSPR